MIKLISIEQGKRKLIKIIKEIISHYSNVNFNIEMQRDIVTQKEIGKKLIIDLY